jgi:hypothetical protein
MTTLLWWLSQEWLCHESKEKRAGVEIDSGPFVVAAERQD